MPMSPEQNWKGVADAWERIFDDVADLGRQFATSLRRSYESRANADAAFGAAKDAVAQTTQAVGHTVDSAREAIKELTEELTEGQRAESLSREIEGAMKASLAELGSMLTDLAARLRSGDADADADADGTAGRRP